MFKKLFHFIKSITKTPSRGRGGFYLLFVYYDNLVVPRQFERLVYDTPALISALGGSLGLTLGMSFLSYLWGFIDLVAIKLNK